ncbi:MAG: hypothetical protein ACKVTZ_04410 [Bacteroidia bacterium]
MKKTINVFLTALVVFCAMSISFAQTSTAKKVSGEKGGLSIGISAGSAIPLGKFTEYNAPILGCAKIGSASGLELSYALHKYFNLMLSGNYYTNPVDATKLAEGVWEENKTAKKIEILNVSPYMMGNVMLGIRPNFSLGAKMAVFVGISGGLLVVQTPSFTRHIEFPAAPVHQEIKGASASAFCYQPQVGLQFKVGDAAALSLFADYLGAKTSFDFTRSDKTSAPTESMEQQIQLVNVGLKLSYTLSKKQNK